MIFTMSWETDPDCQAVLHHHHQPIQHGDITHLDRETLNLLIQPLVQDNPDIIILITTGPPCVDFSRLRHQPPGTQGQQGSLLQRQADIIINLQDDWPDYQILYLLENVIPHPDVEPHFQDISEQLRSRPYVVDAKDGGLISRPRLWWQNIQWETAAHIVHQFTPWQIIQRFQHNTWHLHNPIAALLQPTFHTKDWETPTVLQEGQPFHCLTTQATTDQGRPPPKLSHVDASTWQRWEEHGRQFAPWQYTCPNTLPVTKTVHGNPSHLSNENASWAFPTITPSLLTPPSPTDPETPCWAIPGTYRRRFGCYFSF